ncbi:MAG: hypothetical protein FWG70_01440 [Oscillospiraceae bacterium]|nr:hypothetical protein [Oscillospiraceae bacterium]
MKKLITLLMALMVLFAFTACSEDTTGLEPRSPRSSSNDSQAQDNEDNDENNIDEEKDIDNGNDNDNGLSGIGEEPVGGDGGDNDGGNDGDGGDNDGDNDGDGDNNGAVIVPSGNSATGEAVSSLIEAMQSANVGFDFILEAEGERISGNMCMDGDKFAMSFNEDLFGFSMLGLEISEIKVIVKGKMAYIVLDDLEAYMEMSAEEMGMEDMFEEMFMGLNESVNLDIVDAGQASLNGKTYDYEDYTDEYGGTIRYYIDGSSVVAIGSLEEDFIMYISNITSSIPASMFDVPSDYSDLMEMF